MENKIDALYQYSTYKHAKIPFGTICNRYSNYVDRHGNYDCAYTLDDLEDYVKRKLPKEYVRLMDDLVKGFKEDMDIDITQHRVGDTLYWNVDDFDSVRPTSTACKITKIQNGEIYAQTEDNMRLLFSEDDFGVSVTKNPLFGAEIKREKQQDYLEK